MKKYIIQTKEPVQAAVNTPAKTLYANKPFLHSALTFHDDIEKATRFNCDPVQMNGICSSIYTMSGVEVFFVPAPDDIYKYTTARFSRYETMDTVPPYKEQIWSAHGLVCSAAVEMYRKDLQLIYFRINEEGEPLEIGQKDRVIIYPAAEAVLIMAAPTPADIISLILEEEAPDLTEFTNSDWIDLEDSLHVFEFDSHDNRREYENGFEKGFAIAENTAAMDLPKHRFLSIEQLDLVLQHITVEKKKLAKQFS